MALLVGRSRLPELIDKKKWTQAEFARRLDVSEGFLSQVISGKRFFSYPVAANAAYLLNCSMDDLHERIIR